MKVLFLKESLVYIRPLLTSLSRIFIILLLTSTVDPNNLQLLRKDPEARGYYTYLTVKQMCCKKIKMPKNPRPQRQLLKEVKVGAGQYKVPAFTSR